MRTHRAFPGLQPWAWRSELLSELVSADRLVALRIEPVTRGREPAAFVDLHFSDGERAVTIPLVYLDLAQLDVRELDPLVFPHALLGVVPDAGARGVVERVFPDLERRAMAGGFWAEEVIRYGDARVFDKARLRGFFGAAPLGVALPRVAAAAYARRFAVGKHVVAFGPDAQESAGFVSGLASTCTIAGDDADARAWYGTFEAAQLDVSCDLAIGSGSSPVTAAVTIRTDADATGTRIAASAPLPADVMLSFDPDDGACAASFSIVTAREPFARRVPDIDLAPAVGGSAGRIAVVTRPDAEQSPDADRDEARALAAALCREGFTAEVVTGVDALAAFEPDLVHLLGVRPGGYAREIADWASEHRKPFAVHALHESPAAGGFWGAMVAPYCFGYSNDDRSVAAYLEMLGRRAVEVDGVNASVPYAPPIAGLADSERVLAMADVVLVNSERERLAVEGFRPRRPTFVVPPVPSVAAPGQPIGALVGTDPFILVHAPIWPEANQLLLARAAVSLGVPMVLAGAIADPAYAERVREFAPDQVLLLPEPGPGIVATLYRAASVIADAAWTTRGHSRIATAAALGAAVVSSQGRWLDLPEGGHWTVDPADVRSIARGIGEAWDAAVRSDPRIGTTAAFARERLRSAAAAIVATYAKIVQAI
jgi:hypothetical protein